jgi:hypothetical protein
MYTSKMDRSVELPVSMPGLSAVRGTSTSLHTGMKEHYGVGRIEHGDTEWWGGGKVWRSGPGCILVKQPGDVVRHLVHNGPTTFIAVMLPTRDVDRVRDEGRTVAIPQLETNDERAAPFHRLINGVCEGLDRLSLEVAVAEAISALALISDAHSSQSRPVRRAMEYLRERLGDSITLDDLADYADLDKFHLCRAFRAQVGMPPHMYRNATAHVSDAPTHRTCERVAPSRRASIRRGTPRWPLRSTAADAPFPASRGDDACAVREITAHRNPLRAPRVSRSFGNRADRDRMLSRCR